MDPKQTLFGHGQTTFPPMFDKEPPPMNNESSDDGNWQAFSSSNDVASNDWSDFSTIPSFNMDNTDMEWGNLSPPPFSPDLENHKPIVDEFKQGTSEYSSQLRTSLKNSPVIHGTNVISEVDDSVESGFGLFYKDDNDDAIIDTFGDFAGTDSFDNIYFNKDTSNMDTILFTADNTMIPLDEGETQNVTDCKDDLLEYEIKEASFPVMLNQENENNDKNKKLQENTLKQRETLIANELNKDKVDRMENVMDFIPQVFKPTVDILSDDVVTSSATSATVETCESTGFVDCLNPGSTISEIKTDDFGNFNSENCNLTLENGTEKFKSVLIEEQNNDFDQFSSVKSNSVEEKSDDFGSFDNFPFGKSNSFEAKSDDVYNSESDIFTVGDKETEDFGDVGKFDFENTSTVSKEKTTDFDLKFENDTSSDGDTVDFYNLNTENTLSTSVEKNIDDFADYDNLKCESPSVELKTVNYDDFDNFNSENSKFMPGAEKINIFDDLNTRDSMSTLETKAGVDDFDADDCEPSVDGLKINDFDKFIDLNSEGYKSTTVADKVNDFGDFNSDKSTTADEETENFKNVGNFSSENSKSAAVTERENDIGGFNYENCVSTILDSKTEDFGDFNSEDSTPAAVVNIDFDKFNSENCEKKNIEKTEDFGDFGDFNSDSSNSVAVTDKGNDFGDFNSEIDEKTEDFGDFNAEIDKKTGDFGDFNSEIDEKTEDFGDFGDFNSDSSKSVAVTDKGNDFGDFNSEIDEKTEDFGDFGDFNSDSSKSVAVTDKGNDFGDFNSEIDEKTEDFGDFNSEIDEKSEDFGDFNFESGFNSEKEVFAKPSNEFGDFGGFNTDQSEVINTQKFTDFSSHKQMKPDTNVFVNISASAGGQENKAFKSQIDQLFSKCSSVVSTCFPYLDPDGYGNAPKKRMYDLFRYLNNRCKPDGGDLSLWQELKLVDDDDDRWLSQFFMSAAFKNQIMSFSVDFEPLRMKRNVGREAPLSPASSIGSFDVEFGILLPEPASIVAKNTLLAQSQVQKNTADRLPSISSLKKEAGSEPSSETSSLDLDFFTSSLPVLQNQLKESSGSVDLVDIDLSASGGMVSKMVEPDFQLPNVYGANRNETSSNGNDAYPVSDVPTPSQTTEDSVNPFNSNKSFVNDSASTKFSNTVGGSKINSSSLFTDIHNRSEIKTSDDYNVMSRDGNSKFESNAFSSFAAFGKSDNEEADPKETIEFGAFTVSNEKDTYINANTNNSILPSPANARGVDSSNDIETDVQDRYILPAVTNDGVIVKTEETNIFDTTKYFTNPFQSVEASNTVDVFASIGDLDAQNATTSIPSNMTTSHNEAVTTHPNITNDKQMSSTKDTECLKTEFSEYPEKQIRKTDFYAAEVGNEFTEFSEVVTTSCNQFSNFPEITPSSNEFLAFSETTVSSGNEFSAFSDTTTTTSSNKVSIIPDLTMTLSNDFSAFSNATQMSNEFPVLSHGTTTFGNAFSEFIETEPTRTSGTTLSAFSNTTPLNNELSAFSDATATFDSEFPAFSEKASSYNEFAAVSKTTLSNEFGTFSEAVTTSDDLFSSLSKTITTSSTGFSAFAETTNTSSTEFFASPETHIASSQMPTSLSTFGNFNNKDDFASFSSFGNEAAQADKTPDQFSSFATFDTTGQESGISDFMKNTIPKLPVPDKFSVFSKTEMHPEGMSKLPTSGKEKIDSPSKIKNDDFSAFAAFPKIPAPLPSPSIKTSDRYFGLSDINLPNQDNLPTLRGRSQTCSDIDTHSDTLTKLDTVSLTDVRASSEIGFETPSHAVSDNSENFVTTDVNEVSDFGDFSAMASAASTLDNPVHISNTQPVTNSAENEFADFTNFNDQNNVSSSNDGFASFMDSSDESKNEFSNFTAYSQSQINVIPPVLPTNQATDKYSVFSSLSQSNPDVSTVAAENSKDKFYGSVLQTASTYDIDQNSNNKDIPGTQNDKYSEFARISHSTLTSFSDNNHNPSNNVQPDFGDFSDFQESHVSNSIWTENNLSSSQNNDIDSFNMASSYNQPLPYNQEKLTNQKPQLNQQTTINPQFPQNQQLPQNEKMQWNVNEMNRVLPASDNQKSQFTLSNKDKSSLTDLTQISNLQVEFYQNSQNLMPINQSSQFQIPTNQNQPYQLSTNLNQTYNMPPNQNQPYRMPTNQNRQYQMPTNQNQQYQMSTNQNQQYQMSTNQNQQYQMSTNQNQQYQMSSNQNSQFHMQSGQFRMSANQYQVSSNPNMLFHSNPQQSGHMPSRQSNPQFIQQTRFGNNQTSQRKQSQTKKYHPSGPDPFSSLTLRSNAEQLALPVSKKTFKTNVKPKLNQIPVKESVGTPNFPAFSTGSKKS